jgi:hypothetical protein
MIESNVRATEIKVCLVQLYLVASLEADWRIAEHQVASVELKDGWIGWPKERNFRQRGIV